MSPLFFVAPLLAALLTLTLYLAVCAANRRRLRHSHSQLPGCAFSAITFPLVTLALFIFLPRMMSSSGTGVGADEANRGLVTFEVPDAATDVNFRHAFFSGVIDEADFAVTEAEFARWAAANGWTPLEFYTDETGIHWAGEAGFELPTLVTVTPVRAASDENSEDLDVLNGYYFDDSIGDAGLVVVFDKDGGRAYVLRTSY